MTWPKGKLKKEDLEISEHNKKVVQVFSDNGYDASVKMINSLEVELLSCAETIQRMRELLVEAGGLLKILDRKTNYSSVLQFLEKRDTILALPPHDSEKRVKAMMKVVEAVKKLQGEWPQAGCWEDYLPNLKQALAELADCEEK